MDGVFSPTPSDPNDRLIGDDIDLTGVSVQDFWRWRYATLMDDTTKGDFAEWLVGKLMGLDMPPGGYISGDNVDLRGPKGVTIEVKSSSYWQSWKLRDFESPIPRWLHTDNFPNPPSDKQIQFRGLFKRTITGAKLSKHSGFKSDIYVFAFHDEKDARNWNALELKKWEFIPLYRDQLQEAKDLRDKHYGVIYESFSLTLPQVRELFGGPPMSAKQLGAEATKILSDALARRDLSI